MGVDAVLEEVGLADRARDKFRTYSLGMKQRLAIAATLLKDPNLLIFDEPTNGLDPAGIHEIRATMRGLAARGKTVLVSSHILSEVQQVADTVSIIGRGRLLAEGTVAEILDAAGGHYARVKISDPAQAAAILSAAGFLVSPAGGQLDVGAADGQPDLAQITRVLADRGLYVEELVPVRRDLESVFLELTADEHLGATGPPPSRRTGLESAP
jgi:ABC-type multidrug transport system ATPase subunit